MSCGIEYGLCNDNVFFLMLSLLMLSFPPGALSFFSPSQPLNKVVKAPGVKEPQDFCPSTDCEGQEKKKKEIRGQCCPFIQNPPWGKTTEQEIIQEKRRSWLMLLSFLKNGRQRERDMQMRVFFWFFPRGKEIAESNWTILDVGSFCCLFA